LKLSFCGFVITLMVIAIPAVAFAGAWNLPPGEGQIISTYNYSQANDAYTDIEGLDTAVQFTKREARIFYEHGLTEHITAVVNAAHQTIGFDSIKRN